MRRGLAYLPALGWAALLAGVAGATDLPQTPPVPHFDKMAHFGGYAVLGALLGIGWRFAGRWPARGWLLAFALVLGASDEIRQARMPERHAEFADWVADALGAATGLLIATRIGRGRHDDKQHG